MNQARRDSRKVKFWCQTESASSAVTAANRAEKCGKQSTNNQHRLSYLSGQGAGVEVKEGGRRSLSSALTMLAVLSHDGRRQHMTLDEHRVPLGEHNFEQAKWLEWMGEHNKYRVLDNPRAVKYKYLAGAYRFLSPPSQIACTAPHPPKGTVPPRDDATTVSEMSPGAVKFNTIAAGVEGPKPSAADLKPKRRVKDEQPVYRPKPVRGRRVEMIGPFSAERGSLSPSERIVAAGSQWHLHCTALLGPASIDFATYAPLGVSLWLTSGLTPWLLPPPQHYRRSSGSRFVPIGLSEGVKLSEGSRTEVGRDLRVVVFMGGTNEVFLSSPMPQLHVLCCFDSHKLAYASYSSDAIYLSGMDTAKIRVSAQFVTGPRGAASTLRTDSYVTNTQALGSELVYSQRYARIPRDNGRSLAVSGSRELSAATYLRKSTTTSATANTRARPTPVHHIPISLAATRSESMQRKPPHLRRRRISTKERRRPVAR
ncbi:hypothetical protein BJ912DRAFT_923588 [Pholiota molesta]|nr:hypothetical protein BJ912DRAFT_923588 [Pholiota molesta]